MFFKEPQSTIITANVLASEKRLHENDDARETRVPPAH